MSTNIQVGTILIEEQAGIAHVLGLESELYSGTWSVVQALDSFALDRKIHAAGWNFFFHAVEVKVAFLGGSTVEKIRNAVKRILSQVSYENLNSLEITRIATKRFLGVSYTTVSAHSRHIQQSCYLDVIPNRQALRAPQDRLQTKRDPKLPLTRWQGENDGVAVLK